MMHWGSYSNFGVDVFPRMVTWLIPLLLWSLVWKGMALWAAARRKQGVWFIVFLLVNTAGIGEILYLLFTDGFKEFKQK